ncbi:hypothetical protein ABDX87_19860 [Pseudomonas abietaniphila]|uniref:hypothetical protein n=1 Tax=Pseudomonas abietaniphila TaxID=89065 RepID=UPI00321773D5
MHPIHFIALALASVLAFSLFRISAKAIARDRRYQFAEGRAAGRIEGRSERVSEHNALQQSDLDTLLAISKTLHVAHETWRILPHTERYRTRVLEHFAALNKIAIRIQGEDGTASNGTADQENAA